MFLAPPLPAVARTRRSFHQMKSACGFPDKRKLLNRQGTVSALIGFMTNLDMKLATVLIKITLSHAQLAVAKIV